MCTQIERGKRNNSKLSKVQWSKWHETRCKLNKSYVHQMCVYKITPKQQFFTITQI
jgi:hypothetical protein